MALFGKEPTPQRPPVRTDPAPSSSGALIAKKITIDGTIRGNDALLIEGQVKGEINLESDLTVGPTARIEAKVHARNVTVDGTVVGNITADAKVELRPSANVDGDIKAPKIVVAEGAVFKGSVDMGGSKSQTKVSTSSDQ